MNFQPVFTLSLLLSLPVFAQSAETHTYMGTLEIGKTRSAIHYVGEDSGDLAVLYFATQSDIGKKIVAVCKHKSGCKVTGSIRWLDSIPADDTFAKENASAAGEFVSVSKVAKAK